MGRKSREKRERHEAPAAKVPTGHVAERRQLPVFWIALAVIAVAAVAVLVVSAPADKSKVSGKQAPEFATVNVTGDTMSDAPESGGATGAGETVPSLAGTGLDGKPLAIKPGTSPMVIIAIAHWCPHCQAEVPRIVQWAKQNKLPAGVRIYAVSTAASSSQPNFPPQAWLEDENWPYPVLVDDEVGTAGSALGLASFPMIAFVDAAGKLDYRFSGEMDMESFDKHVQALAPETS